ncbi:UxaA family hydrolase [Alkalicoccobacillus plakortidis]|uniref:Altronate dehydratase family protein n=1 Tax=Alkalicoccobacillus plakortidis TaxID=444060 RepID=A0ABT0XLL7_9BACI|nr:altronate dehydratase family protein [Alkalicoccobacillus plakortidis]MCM2676109.1 altronate dehydratase family protein [Alkalicoccobacillus plakortidis]
MQKEFTQVHEQDSVLITLKDLAKGTAIAYKDREFELLEDIPSGHKIAVHDLSPGEDIIKYGFPIGHATKEIKRGSWVHTDNVKTNLSGALEYDYQEINETNVDIHASEHTFQGYVRKNGEVGIRNEVWIINTVGCINKVAESLARLANNTNGDREFDGVHHFPHPFGCSQLGDDLENTQKLLARLVEHPNAAGVLVLGLGCENNFIESFKQAMPNFDPERIRFLAAQESEDELEEGLALLDELVDYATSFEQQPVPISKLKVGLKCGGSDGLSGITANPMVGAFSDLLISNGGTTILTEVPEMFGAETILMDRAKDRVVFDQMVDLINDFKEYFIRHEQPVYENPSPGNKQGGITTLEEKSLGCVQKGGFATIVDVLDYGEKVSETGLNLVQGPGNDLVSVTALAAAGAHIVLFTTGRGTPFGGPVPTVKISTNSTLYNKKKNWIDYNAGVLVEGKSMEDTRDEFFHYLLDVASGEKRTNNEKNGFREIAIFKDGVML